MLRQVLGLSLLALSACTREPAPPAVPAEAPVARAPAQAARPARKATDAFEVSLAASRTADGKAELFVDITARGSFHVSTEYPTHFAPSEGLAGSRVDLTGAAREPCASAPDQACRLRAAIPFTPSGPRVAGVVAFSVCDPEACLIEKAELAVDLGG